MVVVGGEEGRGGGGENFDKVHDLTTDEALNVNVSLAVFYLQDSVYFDFQLMQTEYKTKNSR